MQKRPAIKSQEKNVDNVKEQKRKVNLLFSIEKF